MRHAAVAALSAFALAFPGAASASGTAPTAEVVSNATIVMHVVTNTFVNFEFVLRDCPDGAPITIEWAVEVPEDGDSGAGTGQYFSDGDQTQRLLLTITTPMDAGDRWVGSGFVTCGAVVIPVTGSGTTRVVS